MIKIESECEIEGEDEEVVVIVGPEGVVAPDASLREGYKSLTTTPAVQQRGRGDGDEGSQEGEGECGEEGETERGGGDGD